MPSLRGDVWVFKKFGDLSYDGKLHLQSERGEISKVILAGEAVGDHFS